ncbi:hypothetical protein [Streptomyces sp. NPDC048710]
MTARTGTDGVNSGGIAAQQLTVGRHGTLRVAREGDESVVCRF